MARTSRQIQAERGRARSPWLPGVVCAAGYAGIGPDAMRKLIKSGQVISRLKPSAEGEGRKDNAVLVYAPSIDDLIMAQPSGANAVADAMIALGEVT